MAEPHVIAALVNKRARLAGELAKLDRTRLQVCDDLSHVDAALRIFGFWGDPEGIRPKATYKRLFRRGELSRLIQQALREKGGEAVNQEIAAYILRRKGWSNAANAFQKHVAYRVRDVRQRMKGTTEAQRR